MRIVIAVVLVVATSLLMQVAHCQFYGGFDDVGGSEYAFGNGLGGSLQAAAGGARDGRGNTGPVVFPPAPPDNGETSGVVVGASGYGFVPPNAPSTRFHQFAFF